MLAAFRMARTARFVATGCIRTNSRFAVTMQQKYWDQGRSTILLTTTCPICFAAALEGRGGSPGRRRSSPRRVTAWTRPADRDPLDVRSGVHANVCRHAAEEDVLGNPSSGTATVLPFRSRMARTWSVPKSSKQPTWPPARKTTGSPASSRTRSGPTKFRTISTSPEKQGLRGQLGFHLKVVHLGESLALQQFSSDIIGGNANGGAPHQPERRRLRRRLRGDRLGV